MTFSPLQNLLRGQEVISVDVRPLTSTQNSGLFIWLNFGSDIEGYACSIPLLCPVCGESTHVEYEQLPEFSGVMTQYVLSSIGYMPQTASVLTEEFIFKRFIPNWHVDIVGQTFPSFTLIFSRKPHSRMHLPTELSLFVHPAAILFTEMAKGLASQAESDEQRVSFPSQNQLIKLARLNRKIYRRNSKKRR